MEETKSTNRPQRLNCENDSCKKPRKLYCTDHDQILCNSCFTALHIRCSCIEIPDCKDIQECFEVVKALLDSIQQYSEDMNASHHIKGFYNDFQIYCTMLSQVEQKLIYSFKDDKFSDLKTIKADILQVQKSFIESSCFTEICKLKELKLIASIGIRNNFAQNDQEECYNTRKFKIFKEKILKEMQEKSHHETNKKVKEIKDKTINDCKEHIKQLENTIEEQTKLNKSLTDKNLNLTKEIKKQTEEFELQKQKIIDSIAEEEQKQKERELQEFEEKKKLKAEKLKDSAILLDKIYIRNVGSNISDIATFEILIDMTNAKQKAVFAEIESSKLLLPKVKRVKIDKISDADQSLCSFFDNCIPPQLDLLCINNAQISKIGIKAGFYINSLCSAIRSVTKEVALYCFEFAERELEQVVKAAYNSERIIISFCDIRCSTSLDFNISQKYKTKFISFQASGRTDYNERTTDWKTDPSKFENIVDAISKCGLKDSLEQVDIWGNHTLSREKVQLIFNAKGLIHISVIEIGDGPCTS